MNDAVVFTRREIEVMQRIASSWHPDEIAFDLGISRRTSDTHRGTVMMKIGGRTNACIVRAAIRLGLEILPPPEAGSVVLPKNKRS